MLSNEAQDEYRTLSLSPRKGGSKTPCVQNAIAIVAQLTKHKRFQRSFELLKVMSGCRSCSGRLFDSIGKTAVTELVAGSLDQYNILRICTVTSRDINITIILPRAGAHHPQTFRLEWHPHRGTMVPLRVKGLIHSEQ